MKTCYVCKNNKEDDEFLFRNKLKGTRHSACKDCYKIVRKKSYDSNKAYYINKSKKRRKEINDWFREIKSKLSCETCGFSHPAALDFHHFDKNKDSEVSNIVKTASKKKILDEIKKCIVLCSNCHRIHHYEIGREI